MKKQTFLKFLSGLIFGIVAFLTLAPFAPAAGAVALIGSIILPFTPIPMGILGTGGAGGGTGEKSEEEKLLDKIKSEVGSIFDGKILTTTDRLKHLEKQLNDIKEGNNMDSFKQEIADLQANVKSLKENGGNPAEYKSDLRKALEAALPQLKALKTKASKEGVNFEYKAAGTMTVGGNVTGANANRLPQPEYIPGVVNIAEKSPSVLSVVDYSSTGSAVIIWVDEANKEGDAEFLGEGELKPLHDFELQPKTSNAKKVAVAIKVSTEMLDDISYMESEIRMKLEKRVRLKADEKVFNGDDTNPDEFDGIIRYASAFVAGSLAATVVTPNNSDAIRAAVAQIVVSSDTDRSFAPNYVFMHPYDVAGMDLQKGSDGHYVLPPFSSADGRRVYGLQIVESTRIPAGYVLVGDFTKSHVREYKNFEISVGFENDDFRKNLVTMLGEMRLHHYISANEAVGFVYDQLSVIKTAIEKP